MVALISAEKRDDGKTWIIALAVREDRRKQGLGTLLVQHVAELATTMCRNPLWAPLRPLPARHLTASAMPPSDVPRVRSLARRLRLFLEYPMPLCRAQPSAPLQEHIASARSAASKAPV
eukprot:COSAG06_NODE_6457_length_2924_cov_9.430442_4_plen_119_part_00